MTRLYSVRSLFEEEIAHFIFPVSRTASLSSSHTPPSQPLPSPLSEPLPQQPDTNNEPPTLNMEDMTCKCLLINLYTINLSLSLSCWIASCHHCRILQPTEHLSSCLVQVQCSIKRTQVLINPCLQFCYRLVFDPKS